MSENVNSRSARRQQQAAGKRKGRKNGPSKGPKHFIKKIFLAIIAVGLALFLGGVGLFAYYASTAPELDESLLKDPLTSELLDKDGNVFLKFGAEKREFVPYKDIPVELRDAILATEDVRFFKHHGMDFYRLGGAVLANFRGGFGSQGASTLTQQVIKNSFLSDEKTLKRKAQEAWLAFKLEREYSKEDIFEMYFNKILMSGRIYGIGTASEYFYGKELSELELPEMALLAGMPQSPNGYNPLKNPERAEKRRNTVLHLMYKHKKITKEEMEAAQAVPVTANLLPDEQRQDYTESKYPAYVDMVLDELEAAGMMSLLSEGVKIQTALDPKAQETVENAINNNGIYESEEMQAAMTVLDTKTGAIVAVGGGRNYSGRNMNFATSDNPRQPGSAIKPILSYGPAIENFSWSTGNIVVDEPYTYKGTNKQIRNVDGKYAGPITIREALYRSRNIPAVKIFEEVGTQKSGDFARKLGLPYEKLNSSHSIGGGEYEFSTVQMAGAYSAFGNGGIYTKPHAVKKIIMRDGKTERNMTPDPVNAMKDSTAYMVTDMLRDVLTLGTGKTANVSGLDIAGKSGTTNYSNDTKNKHNFKNTDVPDSWFAGYTTNYTIAVWGGYKDYTTPIQTYDKGRYVPQNLFRTVMGELSSGKETARFKQPNSVEEATIVKGSNPIVLAGASTPSSMTSRELFVKGTKPTEVVEETVTELEAPSGLSADYDVNTNSIALSWSHNPPDPELLDEPVQFKVSVSVDGSKAEEMTTTSDHSVTFSGVEMGRTYEFSVVAIAGDLVSDPASTSLFIQGESEDETEEPDTNYDENEDGSQDQENGNGDQDGNENNGNNGNNGNQGNQGNPGNNGNNGNGNSGNSGNNNGNVNPDNSGGNDTNTGSGGETGGAPGNDDSSDDGDS
ncbi:PBP1A family penicillin-binding protein [Sporosarcina sp. Te-1]|uniref:PBP1A family penicillin-binding protein n=1 Tax=Sporosarcina sp. Te-1 TaxID=2818390 RepID=UPI001A9EC998|nr:PBP1A family penicillin-binding protein [Sporosarcina sp. Te-1]QTD42149.1 PBP1A family penicillin-binding protein [Sporosarcina sp. Te-1]